MKHTVPSSQKSSPLSKLGQFLPWILIVCSIIGIIASVVITQDKFTLAQNPNFQPTCDLNPIISCGSVMKSDQASAFGFSNPYIGLIGFPVLLTTGVGMLAGARFKNWWWIGMLAGLTFGMLFAYWLLYESVYSIKALCPWCLSVDVAITTAWWYILVWNFREGILKVPKRFTKLGTFVQRHHADILVLWFIVITAAILQHFWYYFGQQI